jgi:hypothetical protein
MNDCRRSSIIGFPWSLCGCENPAYRCAADLEPTRDLCLGYAGAVQFPDLGDVDSRSYWPAQLFTALPCVGQASPSSFPQNLSFELSEYGQQAGYRSTGWCGQVQCLGQGNEPGTKMFQFPGAWPADPLLTGPSGPVATRAPDRSPGGGRPPAFLARFSPCRTGANLADLQGNRPAAPGGILTHGAALHR